MTVLLKYWYSFQILFAIFPWILDLEFHLQNHLACIGLQTLFSFFSFYFRFQLNVQFCWTLFFFDIKCSQLLWISSYSLTFPFETFKISVIIQREAIMEIYLASNTWFMDTFGALLLSFKQTLQRSLLYGERTPTIHLSDFFSFAFLRIEQVTWITTERTNRINSKTKPNFFYYWMLNFDEM